MDEDADDEDVEGVMWSESFINFIKDLGDV